MKRCVLIVFCLVFAFSLSNVIAICETLDFEPNNDFSQTKSSINYTCLKEDVVILGNLETKDDIDIYSIENSFNNGDNLDISISSEKKELALGLFKDDGSLILINDHRNAFLGKRGPSVNFTFPDHYEQIYLVITSTPGFYSNNSVNYQIKIKQGLGKKYSPEKQNIFIDFKGGKEINRPSSNLYLNSIEIENSFIGEKYSSSVEDIKNFIIQKVKRDYEAYENIDFYIEDSNISNYTTVSFVNSGGIDRGYLGLTLNGIDEYNQNKSGETVIFLDTIGIVIENYNDYYGYQPSASDLSQFIANIISHEIGHSLGLVHTTDYDDLMDTTASIYDLFKDQEFKTSQINEVVYPIGSQDSQYMLDLILKDKTKNREERCLDSDSNKEGLQVEEFYAVGHVLYNEKMFKDKCRGIFLEEEYCDNTELYSALSPCPDSQCVSTDSGSYCASEDECIGTGVGECLQDGNYRMCGNYDSDPYLEWSQNISCGQGQLCSEVQVNGYDYAQCQGSCLDTDSDKSYFEDPNQKYYPGTVRGRLDSNGQEITLKDKCLSNSNLIEYSCAFGVDSPISNTVSCENGCRTDSTYGSYCYGYEEERCDGIDNDNNRQVDEGQICPSGKACVYGKCIEGCRDSDFGVNLETYGFAHFFNNYIYDECILNSSNGENIISKCSGEECFLNEAKCGDYYPEYEKIKVNNCLSGSSINQLCGNGILEQGETCDDSNINSSDGCSSSCKIEAFSACEGQPSVCTLSCLDSDSENGLQNEEFKKGGIVSAKGINYKDYCSLEIPKDLIEYYCDESINLAYITQYCGDDSVCKKDDQGLAFCLKTTLCGNGIVEILEKCDDGNINNGDGCSSDCKIEQGYQCVKQPSQCFNNCVDTDGGVNYEEKGTANSLTDVCYNDLFNRTTDQKLMEYYCNFDRNPNGEVQRIIYECPLGCSNGSCFSLD